MSTRRPQDPLALLSLWLGIALVVCVFALLHALRQAPVEAQLDSAHLSGIRSGYDMCLGFKEGSSDQPATARPLAGGKWS